MQKRRLLINALMAAVQVVVVGASFVVLYGFVERTLGIALFGVWALVLATTSASGVANLGLGNSAVKFVSMYLARDDEVRVVHIIQTTVLTLGVIMGIVLVALYPLWTYLIEAALQAKTPELIDEALTVLPYALVSLWLTSTAGAVLSCLDGYQRVDLRSGLLAGMALVYLGLVFVLVPVHGLVGLAMAQVAQAALLLVLAWVVLRHLVPALPLLPYRWHRDVFKEILGYSLSFQAISVTKLAFEPLTKFLVTFFGGATVTGYFEFAYRMVMQLRALIVTAHQAIVPTIADLQERQPDLIRDLYAKSFRLLVFIVVLLLPFCIVATPLISRLWLGSYAPPFVLFATLLFVGWFLNMLSNPAYFAYLGIGRLRWNVMGHLVTGVLNAGLGTLLGWQYGGTGVVVGFVIGLLVGNLITAVAYQHEYQIRLSDLWQKESLVLGFAALAGLALGWYVYVRFEGSWPLVVLLVAVPLCYLAVVVVPLWLHPVRPQVQSWLTTILLRQVTSPQMPGEQ